MTQVPDDRVLVTGAGGFLGSHVVRRLLQDGRTVRAFVRRTTDMRPLSGLDIDIAHGDVTDRESVAAAMRGCTSVIHCAVDTRAWIRDPAPMRRVNVDGLVHTAEAALAAGVRRFVLTSTIATIGRNPTGISDEGDVFNYADLGGPYVLCRVEAEQRFFDLVRHRGLPGIAMNVANTYGPGDHRPTPHGRLLAAATSGKLAYVLDAGLACVGIEDAADAMVLAEQKGRIGERYIVSERWLTLRKLYQTAIDHAGTGVRLRTIPLPVAYAAGFLADGVSRLTGRDHQLSVQAVRLSHIMNDMNARKAREELGWAPRPIQQSIRDAVDFYRRHGML